MRIRARVALELFWNLAFRKYGYGLVLLSDPLRNRPALSSISVPPLKPTVETACQLPWKVDGIVQTGVHTLYYSRGISMRMRPISGEKKFGRSSCSQMLDTSRQDTQSTSP